MFANVSTCLYRLEQVSTGVCYCRAESEMDIVIPADNENVTNKPAKSHTPIKAPTPNPLKVCYFFQ